MKKIILVIAGALPLILSGCYLTAQEYAHDQAMAMCGTSATTTNLTWHYDECSKEQISFLETVQCGNERRKNYCEKMDQTRKNSYIEPICSQVGENMAQYADSLAVSVKSKKLADSEAFKKWTEFKSTQSNIAQDNTEKIHRCYQQAYPQFLATETARRSAIDAQMAASAAANKPIHTTCIRNVLGVNCTSR